MDKPIVLTGIKETLTALEAFDKQAVKAFNKVINSELANAKQSAIGMLPTSPPMSGWRTIEPFKPSKTSRGGAGWPAWDYSKIVDNIGVTKAERRVRRDYTTSAGSLRNAYSSGAIFEVAGRRSNGVGRGTQFIQNLTRFGTASRLIWSVVDRDSYKIRANVSAALDEAKKRLQTALNSQRS